MKLFKNISFMMATCLVLFLASCKDKNDPVNPTLNPDIVSVKQGAAATVAISGGEAPYTVESSANDIATVTVNGSNLTVTGVALGTANVTVSAKDGGRSTLAVAVNAKDPSDPTLDPASAMAVVGGTMTVNISGGTAPYAVTSSAGTIATATVDGTVITVTGVAIGTANITVKGSDNGSTILPVIVDDTEEIFFGPNKAQIGKGDKSFHITQSATIKKGVYTMVGWVYVHEGATLTIEPGTVIKCGNRNYDGREAATGTSLIIKKGAKLIADGTKDQSIVFTSTYAKGDRQAGDWGGIILCGKATNNNGSSMTIEGGVDAIHGGDDDNDNSGILRYVRIEFGGYPYSTDNEINGLTMGSVGKGTIIDHIQVSYCGDDSFEWFGGSVNCKYLVAYHGWDDEFDTDYGYSGKLQFLLGIRHSRIADTSNSNGFESDNNANGTATEPYTSSVFSNVTFIGPIGQDANFLNNSSYINGNNMTRGGAKTGIFQAAMHIRRNSRLSCFNSVAIGYPIGLILENDKGSTTTTWADQGLLKLKNIFFAGMGMTGADANQKTDGTWTGDISTNYFTKQGLNNQVLGDIAALKLKQPNSLQANPNWGQVAGSPLLGAADFTDAFLNDLFLTPVTYVGAFASDSDNWMEGWTNFDPQNTEY